jgi:isopenicillin N synthase-like dioxygenase
MPDQIPIIDLEPWLSGDGRLRRELCARVGQVCHETGFFYIVNHGISARQSADYLAMMKTFFALPLEIRRAIDKHHSAQFRGWEQLGSELTNNEIDYREQIDIGVERDARTSGRRKPRCRVFVKLSATTSHACPGSRGSCYASCRLR